MSSERQAGLLWGGVAALLLILSPYAERFAAVLPACPLKLAVGIPCLACGSSRAGLALLRFDPMAAVAVNPLATGAWLLLIGGGLTVGALALFGAPLREPRWSLSSSVRWILLLVIVANWVYLVRAGV